MRKRQMEHKSRTRKSAPAQRRPQPAGLKRIKGGVARRFMDECRTYVTEPHYEL